MGTLAYTVPVAGTDLNSIADPELVSALNAIKTWANGNIDKSNLAAAIGVQLPTFGTSLPVGPTDGQEFELQVDATNGVVWRFRYRAASASTYKWEFIGGPPLYAEVQANEGTTSTTYGDLATVGPAITLPTLPSGGDFDVTVGAVITPAASQQGYMAYAIGGTAAGDGDAASLSSFGGSSNGSSVVRRRRKTGVAGGVTVTAKYKELSGGLSTFFINRFMSILPVRVG